MAENLQHRRLSPDRKQSTLDETLYGTYSQFGMRYNELVIGEPEFAGFYLCSDINDHDTSVVPISEINKELSKRKIPLFILEWGILYTTINGLKTERLVDPKPIVIDPKQNKIEIKRLLSKGVFDIGKLSENNPDLKGAIAFGFGKAAYLDFVENKYNQNYGDSKGDIFPKDQRRLAREGKHLITVAKKSTLIDYYLFRTPTGKERILRFENYLEHNFGKVVYNRIGPSPIAWLGYGNIALRHIDDRPQSHVTALIEAVEQASYKDVVEYDSHCYLAGFAVAAEHFGDNETVSKVLNYLGRERFSLAKESHEKRIGVDGQLTLLESDIFNQPIN